MPKQTSSFHEIEDIKHDLDSLKTNVVELTKHIQTNGEEKAHELSKKARKRLTKLQSFGKHELHKAERQIKAKPAQSVAIAFAAGLIISQLFGRR